MGDLATRYAYENRYVRDVDEFLRRVVAKTIVPHQLEIQPGPEIGKSICWLKCPYCYGGSSKNTDERLEHERYLKILRQSANGPHGGIPKVIFAGYATDPLFYGGVDELLEVVRENGQVFGFHTKAIQVSDKLIELLTQPDIPEKSYFSVSVDAGNGESYARVHGIEKGGTRLYPRVLENLTRLVEARDATGAPLDISATYLITRENGSEEEIDAAIRDLRATGVDLIRFSFPQVPRGYEDDGEGPIPSRSEIDRIMARIEAKVAAADSDRTSVVLRDLDAEYEIGDVRTLPCFARFVFPTIGFDGFLANCSESAAPHFRAMALGDLRSTDLWDAYYDYDVERFEEQLIEAQQKMVAHGCRCDRKEHVVNSILRDARALTDCA